MAIVITALKPFGLGAFFALFLERGYAVADIKRKEDKPVVIHTKEKTRLHKKKRNDLERQKNRFGIENLT